MKQKFKQIQVVEVKQKSKFPFILLWSSGLSISSLYSHTCLDVMTVNTSQYV